MQVFGSYASTDFDAGVYTNCRGDDLYNIATYDKDSIVPDGDLATSISVYATNLYSSSTYYQQDFINITSNQSIATYNARTYVDFPVQGSRIDVVSLSSLKGAIVDPSVDGVGLQSFSTYGSENTPVVYSVPLKGDGSVQHVRLTHSGFADKQSTFYSSATNTHGTSMGPNIILRPNGTHAATDTWTFTGTSGSQYTIKQQSNGVTTTFNYGTLYGLSLGATNTVAIPGFDVQVNAGVSIGDAANIVTNAPIFNFYAYNWYPNAATYSFWQTPVMDAQTTAALWQYTKNETGEFGTSVYPTSIQVGTQLPLDSTWDDYVPNVISVNDFDPSYSEEGYRDVTAYTGALQGRYSIASFAIESATDIIRYPRSYVWNPVIDSIMRLMGPVITGPNIQTVVGALKAALTDTISSVQRFINSLAVSTAEREYLIAIGNSLGFPKRRYESFVLYRQRLLTLYNSNNSASNTAFMIKAIQQYLNSTAPYIVTPNNTVSGNQWQLGSSTQSILGSSTLLGSPQTQQSWVYEIHVPVKSCPNLIRPDFEAYAIRLRPIGSVIIFVYE